MTLLDFTIRISLAAGLGFVIGLERQLTGHTAGIRTNVLVSLGSCMFVLFSIIMKAPDTTRIAAQIVTGVGFIGSGIIFKDGANVRGINTAATIWCTAAIGVLCSSGFMTYAPVAAALFLMASLLFGLLGSKVQPLRQFDEEEAIYIIFVLCSEKKEFPIRSVIMKTAAHTRLLLTNLESADVIGDKVEIKATFQCGGKRKDDIAEKIVSTVSQIEGVQSAGWERT